MVRSVSPPIPEGVSLASLAASNRLLKAQLDTLTLTVSQLVLDVRDLQEVDHYSPRVSGEDD